MKTFLSAALLMLACSTLLQAQTDPPDFLLWKGQDTLFCTITSIDRTSTGIVTFIEYIDGGSKKIIKEREETEKVTSLRVAGYLMELIPTYPGRSNPALRHMEVDVNGKIRFYLYGQLRVATNDSKGKRTITRMTDKFPYFKLPNGNVYKLEKETLNDNLIPELNKCSAFRSGYKENIKLYTVTNALYYYNNHCKE